MLADTYILHGHVHTQPQAFRQVTKVAPGRFWHFEHMEHFALMCWFVGPCSARIAVWKMTSVSL